MKNQEFEDPLDLIKTINPQMSPEEAVAQVEAFNRTEFNQTKTPVIEARKKLLEESGFNSDDWTFYSNTPRLEAQSDEDMMRSLARGFPDAVEFLVVQGDFIGGITGTQGVDSSWGVVSYRYNPDGYSAFIRVRPKRLRGR